MRLVARAFDLYKRANISKGDSFASHSLSPLKQNQIRHSPPLKKQTNLQNSTHFAFQVSYFL